MLRVGVNYLQIIGLYQDTVSGKKIAVLDLANITYNYITNSNLLDFSLSYNGESVLPLDPTLQPSKLPLFRIIIKCRYKHNYDNRY